jgi:hypothetical protein
LVACVTSAGVGGTTEHVLAHGGGGDIAVFASHGAVDVGFVQLDENDEFRLFFDPKVSVFSSILVPQPPIPGFPAVGSIEPGYDAAAGDLPPEIELNIQLSTLTSWNGIEPLSFSTPAGVAAGYPVDPVMVSGTGGFHAHLLLGLTDLTDDGLLIPDGVYVGEFTMSGTGLADSYPYYMVALVDQLILENEDPEQAAEALGEMVRAYLADPVTNPEPVFDGKNFAFYADAIKHVEAHTVPEPQSLVLAALAFVLSWCGTRVVRSL